MEDKNINMVKRLSIYERLFPYSVDLENTISDLTKLGMLDDDIQKILVNGETYVWCCISSPESGKQYIIKSAKVSLKIETDKSVSILINGKMMNDYFAALEAQEQEIAKLGAKSGKGAEIFKENIELKEIVSRLLAENEELHKIADMQNEIISKEKKAE